MSTHHCYGPLIGGLRGRGKNQRKKLTQSFTFSLDVLWKEQKQPVISEPVWSELGQVQLLRLAINLSKPTADKSDRLVSMTQILLLHKFGSLLRPYVGLKNHVDHTLWSIFTTAPDFVVPPDHNKVVFKYKTLIQHSSECKYQTAKKRRNNRHVTDYQDMLCLFSFYHKYLRLC